MARTPDLSFAPPGTEAIGFEPSAPFYTDAERIAHLETRVLLLEETVRRLSAAIAVQRNRQALAADFGPQAFGGH